MAPSPSQKTTEEWPLRVGGARFQERNARAQAPILILALLHGADGFPRDEAMVCLVREDCQDEPRRPRANVLAHTMHEQLDMRELIVGRYARKNRADR